MKKGLKVTKLKYAKYTKITGIIYIAVLQYIKICLTRSFDTLVIFHD